ncbi:hypothetical protein FCM35_KLT19026 [Carex littledalei]|uniref:Uncharacterized protein n=1 Tax=Carex littledalei TaxID=544730 RepID=A0A833QW42_9POAL|nr:hypothetical protein FCM35_KLT19026 [Carex littledalei]
MPRGQYAHSVGCLIQLDAFVKLLSILLKLLRHPLLFLSAPPLAPRTPAPPLRLSSSRLRLSSSPLRLWHPARLHARTAARPPAHTADCAILAVYSYSGNYEHPFLRFTAIQVPPLTGLAGLCPGLCVLVLCACFPSLS